MKKVRNIAFALLSIVIICTFSATPALAAGSNNEDVYFNDPCYGVTFNNLAWRKKTDTTPMYLYISSTGVRSDHVFVQAAGTNDVNTTYPNNCSYANGTVVDQVICRKGIDYGVHNVVHENNYTYGCLRFRCFQRSEQGTISGVWSVDSTGSYADPV